MDRSLHEEALVAAIAEAPDQREPYLVYGDWLQGHGDARGTLIALLAAGSTGAAAALIREHRYALLGKLDGHAEVELDWFLGFIETIRISARTAAEQIDALAALFDSPSGRFVQGIAIDTPAGIEHVLQVILQRAPKTLARVTIGKPGRWSAPLELVAAFPRMTRPASALWTDAVAKANAQKKLKIELEATKLPALVARAGEVVVDPQLVLIGLRAELEKQRPIGMVEAVRATFTPESVDAFVFALAKQWRAVDTAAVKWAFDTIGPLGGDLCAGFLGHFFDGWSHQRAVQALGHLALIGSPLAITEIVTAMCRVTRHRPRREAARQTLAGLARTRGLANPTALIAQNCPTHVTGMARAAAITTQRWWLYDLMIAGHRLSVRDFDAHVRTHPLRAPLAATLVWCAVGFDDQLCGLFSVDEAGQLYAVDGSRYVVADSELVGVVHPAELTPEQRDVWVAAFERRAIAIPGETAPEPIAQTILQLGRPTFELRGDERTVNSLHDYAHDPVGFYALEARLAERDWYVAEQSDHGTTTAFGRDFERDHVTAIAFVGDGRISSVVLQPIGSAIARQRFDALHRVTRSELLYDLEAAVGRAVVQPTTQLRQPTAAQRPGPAVVERAKSNRSKCVVCGQAIPKDSTRIGVVRMIETPAFKGRATVWAHATCRAGIPELEGIEL